MSDVMNFGKASVFGLVLFLSAGCAGTKNLQALPDVEPNIEMLQRIEEQLLKAGEGYPRLSESPTQKPQSLSSEEVKAIAAALDALGALLNELITRDKQAIASQKELTFSYRGEDLLLEEVAEKLLADIESAQKKGLKLHKEPVPSLGGRPPRRSE